MKLISTSSGTIGPFNSIVVGADRYFADEDEIPFASLDGEVSIIETVISPTVYAPQEVTMRQARLALLENGLLANVQPAINSLPEPDKTKAQIEWDYSNTLQRGNPFVAILGAALGLSSQDLDDLFIQASAL